MFTNKEIVDKIRSLAWSNGTSLTKRKRTKYIK